LGALLTLPSSTMASRRFTFSLDLAEALAAAASKRK
jgi:hypothetical protein